MDTSRKSSVGRKFRFNDEEVGLILALIKNVPLESNKKIAERSGMKISDTTIAKIRSAGSIEKFREMQVEEARAYADRRAKKEEERKKQEEEASANLTIEMVTEPEEQEQDTNVSNDEPHQVENDPDEVQNAFVELQKSLLRIESYLYRFDSYDNRNLSVMDKCDRIAAGVNRFKNDVTKQQLTTIQRICETGQVLKQTLLEEREFNKSMLEEVRKFHESMLNETRKNGKYIELLLQSLDVNTESIENKEQPSENDENATTENDDEERKTVGTVGNWRRMPTMEERLQNAIMHSSSVS